MEEQKIINTNTTTPRITLRQYGSGCSWDIASSSSGDKEELEKIMEMLNEINKKMKETFPQVKKEGVDKKK